MVERTTSITMSQRSRAGNPSIHNPASREMIFASCTSNDQKQMFYFHKNTRHLLWLMLSLKIANKVRVLKQTQSAMPRHVSHMTILLEIVCLMNARNQPCYPYGLRAPRRHTSTVFEGDHLSDGPSASRKTLFKAHDHGRIRSTKHTSSLYEPSCPDRGEDCRPRTTWRPLTLFGQPGSPSFATHWMYCHADYTVPRQDVNSPFSSCACHSWMKRCLHTRKFRTLRYQSCQSSDTCLNPFCDWSRKLVGRPWNVRLSNSCQVRTLQNNLWPNFWQFSKWSEFLLLELMIIQARTWNFVQLLHFFVC